MKQKRLARIFVLDQAAAWIEDQTGTASSVTLLDDSGEYDSHKVHAAIELAAKLRRDAAKIKKQLIAAGDL